MMRFRDRHFRLWSLAIDIAAAQRMRDLVGVDVLDRDASWGARLQEDLALTVDVMYAIVEPQAQACRVSDWSFGRSLRGPTVIDAYAALVDAVGQFFPLPAEADATTQQADADPLTWNGVYELAGFVGVDPQPLTLRDLLSMANGRYEHASRLVWQPSSLVCSLLHNAHSKQAKPPSDFDPWGQTSPTEVDMDAPRTRSVFR